MKKMIASALLLLLIPFRAGSEEIIKKGELLNMEGCIEIALKKQPNIIAAKNTVMVNQSKVGEANANYYPQIDWTSGYSKISSASGTTTNRSFDQYTNSIILRQNIFDFGKTATQVRIQSLTLDSSRLDFENVSEQVIFNVKQAYYGVLQAKRNRDVAEETVKQ